MFVIFVFLAECMFTDFEFMKKFTGTIRRVFPVVRYAYGVYTPAYLGGQCGFLLASKDKVRNRVYHILCIKYG